MGRLEIEGRKLEDWKIVEEKVKRAIEEIERERGKEKEKKRGWWDEKCEIKKEKGEKEIERLEKERKKWRKVQKR